jgi:glyoxylase-like metal-dependent hydrolase (beta-lactamase superfamily II)
MKIIDNVYVVPEVIANPYIIMGTDGLTLIDTGLPRNEKTILAYVASLSKSARDVKRIILTHSDFDHVGSLAALHKLTGARTYASKIEADAIALGKPSRIPRMPVDASLFTRLRLLLRRLFVKVAPFQVHETLTDGQVLPVLGGLRVVETPGHTPGHISLFAPEAGILFCGDSMVTYDNNIDDDPRSAATWDQTSAKASIVKQSLLGAHIVCSGHGPVVTDAAGKFPV